MRITCSRFDGIGRSCYPRPMPSPLPRSPRILDCRWGLVRVDGHGTVKDAKLYPGGARAWDWRETGTRHRPGIQPADVAELVEHGATTVVLSRGVLRMLQVCPETVRELERDGVAVEVLPTPEAVERYNRLADREAAVGALIHSTC
jgi:hypothetical protein